MKKILLMFAAALSLSACTGNSTEGSGTTSADQQSEATETSATATTTDEAAPADPTAIPVLTGENGEKDAQALLTYIKANIDKVKELKEFEGLDKTMKDDSLLKVMEGFAQKSPAYKEAAEKVLGGHAIEKIIEDKMKELFPEAAAKSEQAAQEEAE
ncbi:MAG: hypothetical protein MJZ74_08365 [Muribaculaceae bacterium]|nr:hypothetical protein [Muribaculaceae bacterium]